MKYYFKLSIISILGLLLAACGGHHVNGNGKIQTRDRSVAQFNEIAVGGNYQLNINVGKKQSLQIKTDSNIDPLITTRVENGRLYIDKLKGYTFASAHPVEININVQSLNQVLSAGSNIILIDGINNQNFILSVGGAGQVNLSGNTNQFRIKAAGSGSIDASQLKAKSVNVEMVGDVNVEVNASDTLSYRIIGSGDLKYSGSPKITSSTIRGVGNVSPLKK